MREILILEAVYGYKFDMENDQITYEHIEGPTPDEQKVLPFFQEIRAQRNKAVDYLRVRSQPVDIAEHLWQAAEKAQYSAVRAEKLVNIKLAEQEWRRSFRFFAASAKAFGISDPFIPWDEWIPCYERKIQTSSGDARKV